MSIGRLTTSAFSGAIENTLALAHLNSDFSLVKIQAPAEYQELGLSLSKHRSEDAENGISHVTARKLGALFEELVPKTPNLFKAYGLRASKVIKDPKLNPRGSREHGIFADHIGADGTTIWAAATSGSAAIAAHLLACMLARMWPPAEATSIWAELVAERKRTSHIQLDREQLARWDAGARAWLSTADEAFKLNQKQLLLIINNIGIPVTTESKVSDGVIVAWQDAMLTLEKLLAGESQSVKAGAPLLGLSSWHLYPDMLVLGDAVKTIRQNDDLFPAGALVTLGLQNKELMEKGVYWSLPLAFLRYYSSPVISEASLNAFSSRISLDQFLQVALGSLMGQWIPSETGRTAEDAPFNWLQTLHHPCKEFLTATGHKFQEVHQLVQCGRRRFASFLSPVNIPRALALQTSEHS
ncbi:hypothetical protein K469DRAFT_727501 [Zopfia rhizophila CBS 207.26]|uniref:Uncharacterized protein n=1 Tax=Zopfia rhizophila CBS 207.26 TaxID=1314779 RepID=A0A6A6ESR5_9PEZI|nr:hypothetical protein K469DRAFT_727501 [Zopfia rhizophila CBS 207.26]